MLNKVITCDGHLKETIINYIGEKLDPENGEVTLEMVISTFAEEFPEMLLTIAEENYLKGYSQGLDDAAEGVINNV